MVCTLECQNFQVSRFYLGISPFLLEESYVSNICTVTEKSVAQRAKLVGWWVGRLVGWSVGRLAEL